MTPDSELLRRFAKTNSQDAFAELVKHHVNLVYSAALRQVNGDEHFAKDVAQTVFTDLARKAGSLSRRATLTGWLYTSAHFAAAKIVRGENRRRDREEKFMREPTSETAPDADWEKLRPTLDDAMHELKETDREAVLLRYFKNRQFAEVGAKLGLNENAARMRVERALEKLRDIFSKRGITTATALASVISANAIQIAPANLAATLTTASIATAGTGTFTLLKIMTATRLKLGLSALVVAGVTTAFVLQHQTQEKLRAENESLMQQLAQLQTDNESISNRLVTIGDSKSLSDEQFIELLKLRGEVALLRQQKNVLPKAVQSETNSLPDAKIIQIHLRTQFVSLPSEALQALGVAWMSDAQDIKMGFLAGQQFKVINEAFQGASDVNVMSTPQVVTINGEQAEISATRAYPVFPVGGTNENATVSYTNIGVYLNVRPYFSTNSSTFNLNLNAKLTQLYGDPSQPDVQTIQMTNQVTLSPGQTVVMETEIPSGGWLLDSTNVPDSKNLPAGPRSLLMFVTPTVVDSDFMKPLHQQSSLPKPASNQ